MPDHQVEAAPLNLHDARPKEEIEVVRVAPLSAIPWLFHGFSTRRGGVSTAYSESRKSGELNLAFTEADDRANVAANRELFLKAVTGDSGFPLVTVRQIHSAVVRHLTPADTGTGSAPEPADGIMTAEPGVLLGIQTADCIPVLVADHRERAVAAFHAGWRGTLKRIVEEGVQRMRREFGSKPEDLIAAIGPGIGQCCYRVGEEVRNEFASQFSYAAELFRERTLPASEGNPGPGLCLNLVDANRRQLLDAGVAANAISIVGECTTCRTDRYFSYRAERGITGRMLSVIGMSRN
jgi:YfiH family protein